MILGSPSYRIVMLTLREGKNNLYSFAKIEKFISNILGNLQENFQYLQGGSIDENKTQMFYAYTVRYKRKKI